MVMFDTWRMKIIVTGGAGFIGSALVWALNERGERDLVIVDEINHDEKEHNLGGLEYEELIMPIDFRQQLKEGLWDNKEVGSILHMGACSDTTEQSWDYLEDNNVEYSKDIIRWCVDRNVRCVYASSAATYGDGSKGFSDNHDLFDELKPLNLYGKSKLLVDVWARDAGYLDQVAGLRYFNVFGPNEWHKEGMRSVILKKFPDVNERGVIELFKSKNPDYADGEQERDFIYVKDVVKITLSIMDHQNWNGVVNVGTGKAQSWNDVARALFRALDKKENIKYIDLPDNLKNQYQYHTQADLKKLIKFGLKQEMTNLEEAIEDYVQNYLVPHKHLGGY
jgi:ADP-L-glycero-D-manno-heptose 6-epimerase